MEMRWAGTVTPMRLSPLVAARRIIRAQAATRSSINRLDAPLSPTNHSKIAKNHPLDKEKTLQKVPITGHGLDCLPEEVAGGK
jgi:hypothetical protein